MINRQAGEICLERDVIAGGYCVGCGACTSVSNKIHMKMDTFGRIQAEVSPGALTEDENSKAVQVCPFGSAEWNEERLGRELFGGSSCSSEIGYYRRVYAGRVAEFSWYNSGSSGGVAKWLLYTLLEKAAVDRVIQVVACDPCEDHLGRMYKFKIIKDKADVIHGSKSVYYPVELSEILTLIEDEPLRYAITATPCFAKALRRVSMQNKQIRDSVQYIIGIVCGHLKSTSYAELIAWQKGIRPTNLKAVDFRYKIEGRKANEKGVIATDKNDCSTQPDIVQNLYGTNYGHGFFKYSACDYCDDVVGETADVSIGDAWLPEFLAQGTSLIIIRNNELLEIMEEALNNHDLELKEISAEMAAASQRSGFRHRRDYLQYRLYLKKLAGEWYPQKRVLPSKSHLLRKERRIVEARSDIMRNSHVLFKRAKEENNLASFIESMQRQTTYLDRLPHSKFKRIMGFMLKKLGIYETVTHLKAGVGRALATTLRR